MFSRDRRYEMDAKWNAAGNRFDDALAALMIQRIDERATIKPIVILFIILTCFFYLYPAYSRVGRGNLIFRHSIPHFPPIFSRHCVMSGDTQLP